MAEPTTEQKYNLVDDIDAIFCDKRKLSPDMSLEQANVLKKLKDSKTQPGKYHHSEVANHAHRKGS